MKNTCEYYQEKKTASIKKINWRESVKIVRLSFTFKFVRPDELEIENGISFYFHEKESKEKKLKKKKKNRHNNKRTSERNTRKKIEWIKTNKCKQYEKKGKKWRKNSNNEKGILQDWKDKEKILSNVYDVRENFIPTKLHLIQFTSR